MTYSKTLGASALALALAVPAALSPMLTSPAHAQFFGRIVYDPSNYAQNVLTAARTLEQINNQIKQLQNQARNLASLPFNVVNRLRSNLRVRTKRRSAFYMLIS